MHYAYPDPPGGRGQSYVGLPLRLSVRGVYPLKPLPVALMTILEGSGGFEKRLLFASLPGPPLVRRNLRLNHAGGRRDGSTLLSPLDGS
jgi:hypothetical protein